MAWCKDITQLICACLQITPTWRAALREETFQLCRESPVGPRAVLPEDKRTRATLGHEGALVAAPTPATLAMSPEKEVGKCVLQLFTLNMQLRSNLKLAMVELVQLLLNKLGLFSAAHEEPRWF